MTLISFSKHRCDICGTEIECHGNSHMDPNFRGWVSYKIDRMYGSVVTDASDDYCGDGRGDLCPKCFADTKIKLRDERLNWPWDKSREESDARAEKIRKGEIRP